MTSNGRTDRGPILEAGQIWLIEQCASSPLAALDRDALGRANVVLYERALADVVSEALPLGSYAEALPPRSAPPSGTVSPRAVAFAAEGWSVVQLVEARPGWRDRLRQSADRLAPLGGDDLTVLAIARETPGQAADACLRRLSELVAEFADDEPPTVIFGPLALRSPAAHAFTANGLAG